MIELSLVMPCLNEEKTIGKCVEDCLKALKKYKLNGEVVVCDNESKDNSVKIARKLGARIVLERKRGYGNAGIKGMNSAKGKYILKLDADGSYNPDEVIKFVEKLRKGYQYVIGSRYKGKILPRAMPWSHQYIGNPLLTLATNLLCKGDVSDVCCGMKAFERNAWKKAKCKAPGMEFGPETTIKARQAGLSVAEVPIKYYPDKRERKSNLKQWRDGIGDIIFILQESWLFKKYP
jgi:glycosyltransferase involved in cell wall biosynthesis